MKTKSLIALIIAALLTALIMLGTFAGLNIGGKQIISPAVKSLSLGLDLKGGVYTVFRADREDYTESEFNSLLSSTQEVLTKRLTNEGYTEATVSLQGTDSIRVEIPEAENPEDVVRLIGKPAHLEFVEPNGNVILEGKDIREVSPSYNNQSGLYEVAFELSDAGAKAFYEATQRLTGEVIAIVLDGETISDPVVNEPISGGQGSISFPSESIDASYKEAAELTTLIMSGALPLNLTEDETRSISATLGEDAISKAMIAGVIGACLIFVFMLIVYRLPGLMADIALCWYIAIVFILLALFKIQLTLPGIAGILLGIGMAVDANVVIFERFREELAIGRSCESAVKAGYKNALRAIVDSNITTLIAAFVLMYFGTGSVKGFSYTLCLSVIVSMFTAIFATRFLLNRAVRLGIKRQSVYTRPLGRKRSFKVMRKARLWALIPAVIAVVAIVLNLTGAGINLGIDFTGGTLVEYDLGEDFSTEDIVSLLKNGGQKDFTVSKTTENGSDRLQIRIRLETEKMDYSPALSAALDGINELKPINAEILKASYVAQNALDEAYIGAHMFVYEGLYDSDRLKDIVEDALEAANLSYGEVHAAEFDDDTENPRTVVYILPEDGSASGAGEITALLRDKYPGVKLISAEYAGAVSSSQLIKNALLSMLASLVLMLIYIAIRFDLHSGLASLVGLFHDVVIMLAAMSFFGFAYQVNSPFIAALLTIVGYSINDTIIVFDRIRENKKRFKANAYDEIVNESVSRSLPRTINTSITTLLTLAALFIFGTESIREFAFPLIAGMLAGTYSSNLISGPFWAWLQKKLKKRKAYGHGSGDTLDA